MCKKNTYNGINKIVIVMIVKKTKGFDPGPE